MVRAMGSEPVTVRVDLDPVGAAARASGFGMIEPMFASAEVTSLGMIQTLFDSPWAICGSTWRYW